ncbi:MAG TPA: dNTP triphosphohydrolase [Pyrinomonadaceae bacterium]|jgi:dGTPase|nr:dNTP triphosphohydrolase [Pyrinomonadaceae bacterium]
MDWQKLLNNNRLRTSRRADKKDARNDFESDFGRIIFSPALRRMHDKTQVFPLTSDDNIHSRLTHSLEVMSVGYSLALSVCESQRFQQRLNKNSYELFREVPVIVKNLCLIHDIGNPPFGHFGETVIQNYFKGFFEKKGKNVILSDEQKNDFLNFDGNAQGLRVLTKLQILNDLYGLNLTYATLGAYIKYPNVGKIDKRNIETKKVGVFSSEKDCFLKIAEECGLNVNGRIVRHPLCYLMEAADSICYLVMDIEDGYNTGLFDLEYLHEELKNIPSVKNKLEEIITDDEKYPGNTTKIVNIRIHIIQTLVNLAIANFEGNIDEIENGTYNKELIDEDENLLAAKLQSITRDRIFGSRDITSLEITGHSVIGGLLDHYFEYLFHENDKYFNRAITLISGSIKKAAAFEEGKFEGGKANVKDLSDYSKLRMVVDFVSGMTDQYALSHYQKISGQKIS